MEKTQAVPGLRGGQTRQLCVELELRSLGYTRDVVEASNGLRGLLDMGQDSMESVPKLWLVQ